MTEGCKEAKESCEAYEVSNLRCGVVASAPCAVQQGPHGLQTQRAHLDLLFSSPLRELAYCGDQGVWLK